MLSSDQSDSHFNTNRIIAIKDGLVALGQSVSWTEIGMLTDCQDLINSTYRLLRSLDFGDPDYDERVLIGLKRIVERDSRNEQIVLKYLLNQSTLESCDAGLYSRLQQYADSVEPIEEDEVASIDHIRPHIERIRENVIADPEQAVGSCKDLVEASLKTFLEIPEEEVRRSTIPQLIKLARNRITDGVPEIEGDEDMLKILGSLSQIIQSVASIRNKHGTGHGRGPTGVAQLPQPYVLLLANASISIATFLTQMLGLRNGTTDHSEGKSPSDIYEEGDELPW